MAKIWERNGVKLTFHDGGKVGVEIDVPAITAAHQLEPVGRVHLYEIDTQTMGKNLIDEANRLARRLKKAVKK